MSLYWITSRNLYAPVISKFPTQQMAKSGASIIDDDMFC